MQKLKTKKWIDPNCKKRWWDHTCKIEKKFSVVEIWWTQQMTTATGVGQNNIDDLYLEKIKCEKPVWKRINKI